MQGPTSTRSRRAGRFGALSVLLVGLVACTSAEPTPAPAEHSRAPVATSSATSVPSSAVASSAAPEPSRPAPVSTAAPPPSAIGIRPDAFARVATDDLRVRSKPFVGDASRKLEPLLWNGADLFVIDGPVSGSGYDWYLVLPMGEVDLQVHPDPPPAGWVAAASKDGERWLEPAPEECFENPLGWLQYDLNERPIGLSGLACFGDRSLSFTASLSIVTGAECSDQSGPWTIQPSMFAPCRDPRFRLADPDAAPSEEVHALVVTLAPAAIVGSVPPLKEDQWLSVDVVGQYAYPTANQCRATPTGGDGEGPPPPEVVVLECRSEFVVTKLKAHVDT